VSCARPRSANGSSSHGKCHAIPSNGSSSARRHWNSTPQDEVDDHATLPTRECDGAISIVTTSPSISPMALSSLTPAGEILRSTTTWAPPRECTVAGKLISCRSNVRRLRRRAMWCAIFGCRKVLAGRYSGVESLQYACAFQLGLIHIGSNFALNATTASSQMHGLVFNSLCGIVPGET